MFAEKKLKIYNKPDMYQSPKKVEELESIRGIAAFLVVFFHIPKWNPVLDTSFINNSYLMVDLFFVISGFVICGAYSTKIKSKKDLMRFQFLRLGRLYPVHIVFLIAFLIIEIVKYVAFKEFKLSGQNSTPFLENDFWAFIDNLLLIQSVLPNSVPTYNFPAWSISVEFYTYAAFGLIVLFFGNIRYVIFVAISLVSLALLVTNFSFGSERLLRCFIGFFIGCLTCGITTRTNVSLPPILSLLAFLAIVVFIASRRDGDREILIYFLTALLIIAICLSKPSNFRKILKFNLFTWLGRISYSVYMSHAAVIWFVNQIFRVLLKKAESVGMDGKAYPQLSIPETLIGCVAIFVIILVVSEITYRLVERPFRQKSRDFAFKRIV